LLSLSLSCETSAPLMADANCKELRDRPLSLSAFHVRPLQSASLMAAANCKE